MTDDGEEVELGWIKVRHVLNPDQPAGVDIDVEYSERLGVLEAVGMLAAAQLIVWDQAGKEEL